MKHFLAFAFALFLFPDLRAQFLTRIPITQYELRWKDSGSGNDKDLAFWHPINIPEGYYVLGSIGEDHNNDNPNGNVTTYAYKTADEYVRQHPQGPLLVVSAIDFEEVWNDGGTGSDWDGSLWRPVCPNNYVPLGLVGNRSHSKPDVQESRCGCILNNPIILEPLPNRPPLGYQWNAKDCTNWSNALGILNTQYGAPIISIFGTYGYPQRIEYGNSMANDKGFYWADILPSALVQPPPNTLIIGQTLPTNHRIISDNGIYSLRMQSDGNLCIKTEEGDQFVWCSMVYGFDGGYLIMQPDGNLVVYDRNNHPHWSSQTHEAFDAKFKNPANKPVKAVLENNGTLKLYTSSGQVVWTSGQ